MLACQSKEKPKPVAVLDGVRAATDGNGIAAAFGGGGGTFCGCDQALMSGLEGGGVGPDLSKNRVWTTPTT